VTDRRRALDAFLVSMEVSCEVLEEPWGSLVRSAEFHRLHMANFLWLRELPPGGLDAALRRMDEAFHPYGIRDRPIYVEDPDLSRRLEPEFRRRGYAAKPEFAMYARRPPSLAANPAVTVRPARDEATRDDHDAVAGLIDEEDGYDHEVSFQLRALHWRRQRELDAEVYVAYLEAQPVGTVALQEIGGVGVVYDVQTVPRARRRGVAATMVLHGLSRARARGADLVFLLTPVESTAYRLYERLGFAREGTLDGYLFSTPPRAVLTAG